MSQQRLRDFEEPLLSFDHNIFNLGLHNPGRYCGFDTILPSGDVNLGFGLSHAATGILIKNQINENIGPVGVLLSPQGVLVMEDAAFDESSFEIDTNAGNAAVRFDILICQHNFVVSTGGEDAVYSIIKGTIGTPIKPVPTDPFKQIIVGTIVIPPGATNINQCTWQKAKCPDSGDGEDARLTDPNIFKSIQIYNKSATPNPNFTAQSTVGSVVASLYKFQNDGNLFEVLPSVDKFFDGIKVADVPNQEGMRINVMINEHVTVRESYAFESTSYYSSEGYRALRITPGMANVTVANGGGSTLGIKPSAGEIWELELVFYSGRWYVSRISGAGSSSGFKRGDIISWYGDINVNFDAGGLGINLKAGFQICTGALGTPDLRGKIRAMATNVPSAGRPNVIAGDNPTSDDLDYIFGDPYTLKGKAGTVLIQDNLPNVVLPYIDPQHSHFFNDYYHADKLDVLTGATNIQIMPSGYNNNRGSGDTDGDNTYWLYAIHQTSPQGSDITIHTGGLDKAVGVIPPCWMEVLIMKL